MDGDGVERIITAPGAISALRKSRVQEARRNGADSVPRTMSFFRPWTSPTSISHLRMTSHRPRAELSQLRSVLLETRISVARSTARRRDDIATPSPSCRPWQSRTPPVKWARRHRLGLTARLLVDDFGRAKWPCSWGGGLSAPMTMISHSSIPEVVSRAMVPPHDVTRQG